MKPIINSFFTAFLCIISWGCGGGITEVAEHNRTFYTQVSVAQKSKASSEQAPLEQRFPFLDHTTPARYEYLGYTILNERVHLSRPSNWVVRKASNEGGRRFIQYVSPNEYLFSVYEWPDQPTVPWHLVIERYEQDVAAAKAEIVEHRIPVAMGNGQGRAYILHRKVPGAKAPYVNTCREILLRSDHRIILVQIVQQSEGVALAREELQHVLNTLQID